MYSINRSVAIIKPKQPFLDWLNSVLEDKSTIEKLREDCLAILLPSEEEDSQKLIKKHYKKIFEEELFSWCADDALWPQNKSYKRFLTWFEVEIHSIVMDAGDNRIKREGDFPPSSDHQCTKKQGQYLSFIYHYIKLHGYAPAQAEIQKFFQVSSASVHNMISTLIKRGFLTQEKGKARSLRVVLPEEEIPSLEK